MTLEIPSWAGDAARALPYPLLFATVSGAHLYGFASVDSDLDLRAAHLLPAVHAELKALVPGLVTRHHAHHYLGFAAGQEKLYRTSGQLKPALYTLRVLLTGIHLMRTGHLETDLRVLGARLAYLPDLIAAKREADLFTRLLDSLDEQPA